MIKKRKEKWEDNEEEDDDDVDENDNDDDDVDEQQKQGKKEFYNKNTLQTEKQSVARCVVLKQTTLSRNWQYSDDRVIKALFEKN